jgi:hypothetical protein
MNKYFTGALVGKAETIDVIPSDVLTSATLQRSTILILSKPIVPTPPIADDPPLLLTIIGQI